MTTDDRQFETAVRASLRRAAATITPTDRLDAILGDARSGEQTLVPVDRRRWTTALAAAAAAAACVALVWGLSSRPVGPTPTPGGTSTASTSATSRPSPTTTTQPTQSSTGPVDSPVISSALPVYVVSREADVDGRTVLSRVFLPEPPATATTRVADAVWAAAGEVKGAQASAALPEAQDIAVTALSAAGIEIRITMSGTTADLTPEGAAALVYTAGAAAGLGDVPVRLVIVDPGGREITPSAYAGPLTRSSFPPEVLASIWIDGPSPNQFYSNGAGISASGVASVFEAALSWTVEAVPPHGPVSKVATGNVMASGGAPARGSYSIPLPTLGDGHYRLVVTAYSAKDGSVASQRSVEFDVGVVVGG